MISETIAHMMSAARVHFMIPGDMVASVTADNALRHAFLVLTKVRYAKIPVVDADDHFKGLVSLPMITEAMLGLDEIREQALDELCVGDVMETGMPTIDNPYDLEQVLHLLVDSPFLPVVQKDGTFTGIVTRREVMKGLNYIAHNLEKHYQVTQLAPKD